MDLIVYFDFRCYSCSICKSFFIVILHAHHLKFFLKSLSRNLRIFCLLSPAYLGEIQEEHFISLNVKKMIIYDYNKQKKI